MLRYVQNFSGCLNVNVVCAINETVGVFMSILSEVQNDLCWPTVMVDPKSQSPSSEFQDQNSGTFGKSEFQRESG